jgi:hypothetical protein
MLIAVYKDIFSFILFIAICLAFFSMLLSILLNVLDDYEGISMFGYFEIALRKAIGDYDTRG